MCIQTTFGHILRLPCLQFANFSIVKTGFKLNHSVITTFNYFDEDECENECIKHRLCKSINFKTNICELNSKSTEDPFDNVQLSNVTGWTYKSTDYNERNVSSSTYYYYYYYYYYNESLYRMYIST